MISSTNDRSYLKETLLMGVTGAALGAGLDTYMQKQRLKSPELKQKLETDVFARKSLVEEAEKSGNWFKKISAFLEKPGLKVREEFLEGLKNNKVAKGAIAKGAVLHGLNCAVMGYAVLNIIDMFFGRKEN